MGSQTSKRNIVADSLTKDDSESYNLVNIHAPTANIGISIICGLVGAVGLYRLYRYCLRATWCRPGGQKERKISVQPTTASVDMTGHVGHAVPDQRTVMFGGGDARSPFWKLKEDPCWTCIESSRLEQAGRAGGCRRSRERLAQDAQGGGGHQRSVYGGPTQEERPGRRAASPSPMRRVRARSVESF